MSHQFSRGTRTSLQLPTLDELWRQTLGWQPNLRQHQHLQQLYTAVIAGNRQLNLTRITEPEAFWEKHLWDSLWGITPWFNRDPDQPLLPSPPVLVKPGTATQVKIIDIGTGGGFPGLPIAIAQPTWTVTLLDATRKKITFLDTLIQTLGLDQVNAVCDRAEHLGQQQSYRQSFDLVVMRAIGPAPVCAEYALPVLKLGGLAVLYRGQWTPAETNTLDSALSILGGEIAALTCAHTPLTHSIRHCIYIRKQHPTSSKFPRNIGIPSRHPLARV